MHLEVLWEPHSLLLLLRHSTRSALNLQGQLSACINPAPQKCIWVPAWLKQERPTGANVGACGFVDVLCFSRCCENAEQREDAFNQAASELEGSWQ